ncbi:MAG: tetratricopeptide repeat protein [Magnetococcus sp. DMHC-6]
MALEIQNANSNNSISAHKEMNSLIPNVEIINNENVPPQKGALSSSFDSEKLPHSLGNEAPPSVLGGIMAFRNVARSMTEEGKNNLTIERIPWIVTDSKPERTIVTTPPPSPQIVAPTTLIADSAALSLPSSAHKIRRKEERSLDDSPFTASKQGGSVPFIKEDPTDQKEHGIQRRAQFNPAKAPFFQPLPKSLVPFEKSISLLSEVPSTSKSSEPSPKSTPYRTAPPAPKVVLSPKASLAPTSSENKSKNKKMARTLLKSAVGNPFGSQQVENSESADSSFVAALEHSFPKKGSPVIVAAPVLSQESPSPAPEILIQVFADEASNVEPQIKSVEIPTPSTHMISLPASIDAVQPTHFSAVLEQTFPIKREPTDLVPIVDLPQVFSSPVQETSTDLVPIDDLPQVFSPPAQEEKQEQFHTVAAPLSEMVRPYNKHEEEEEHDHDHEEDVTLFGRISSFVNGLMDMDATWNLNRLKSKGIRLTINGHYWRAEPLLSRALTIDPQDTECLFHLGFCYYKSGRLQEGIGLLEKAARQQMAEPRICTILGMAYIEINDYRTAIEVLKEAAAKTPYKFNLNYQLGIAYQRSHDDKKAIQAFRTALKLRPGHPQACKALNTILDQME